jgi:hypothetical protein
LGLAAAEHPDDLAGPDRAQICRSLKNPKENKNRNVPQLVEDLAKDELVLWGWNPGEGRNPVPMPHDEFVAKVKKWQAAGAPCPANVGKKTNS